MCVVCTGFPVHSPGSVLTLLVNGLTQGKTRHVPRLQIGDVIGGESPRPDN